MTRFFIAVITSAALFPTPGLAQALPRGDAGVTVGWLNARPVRLDPVDRNNWFNHGLFVGGRIGWYWTEHHKTEIEAGVTNDVDFHTYRSVTAGGVQGWGPSLLTFQLRRVAVGQRYQFGHNQWVHPHVGAGLDLTWERVVERADPVIAYTQAGPRELSPGGVTGPTTTLRARPYVETGLKAYMSPRAFFRTDLRLLTGGGVSEVLVGCGLGIDF